MPVLLLLLFILHPTTTVIVVIADSQSTASLCMWIDILVYMYVYM